MVRRSRATMVRPLRSIRLDDLADQAALDGVGLAEDEGAGAHGRAKLADHPEPLSVHEHRPGRAHHVERTRDDDLPVGGVTSIA